MTTEAIEGACAVGLVGSLFKFDFEFALKNVTEKSWPGQDCDFRESGESMGFKFQVGLRESDLEVTYACMYV